jgi:uncharacterized protein
LTSETAAKKELMARPLVIYHANCLDGFGAAAVIFRSLREGDGASCDFFAAAYGRNPPDASGRDLYIVDFSYPREELTALCREAATVTVIDHHLTGVHELAGLDKEHDNLRLVLDMEKSGAVLTWEYFNPDPPPPLLLHIQDRDLWRFELPDTNDLYASLSARPYDFVEWCDLLALRDLPPELLAEGRSINRYRRKMIDLHLEKAVMATIAGYKVPMVNCYEDITSDLLAELAVGHPFAAGYQDQGRLRKWSLRSAPDGADVAAVAELFGGGGHRHAAGFITRHAASVMTVSPRS